MSVHGTQVLTTSTPIILNAAGLGVGSNQQYVVNGEFHLLNEGPDIVRLTMTNSSLGANEGYPLAAGESKVINHTGIIYARCDTATGGNPTSLTFLITSGR